MNSKIVYAAPLILAAMLPVRAQAQSTEGSTALKAAGGATPQADQAGYFQRDRNVSVRQRPKPEYSKDPIPFGGFQLLANITGGLELNDNIYASDTNEKSDTIVRIQPSAILASNWNRHQLAFTVRASDNEYLDHDSESTFDYFAGVSGRLDVYSGAYVRAGASFERDTEPRTASGVIANTREPVRYYQPAAFLEAVREFNRVRVTGRADVRDYQYDNANDFYGAPIYEKNRDRTETKLGGKVEYAVSPDTAVFVQAVANWHDYRNRRPADISRTSNGYDVSVGVNTDISALLRGEVSVGYLSQSYDDSRFKDISGLGARGQLEWFPSQLTTVTGTVSRSIEDGAVSSAAGYIASSVGVQVDHELRRNIILTGGLSYENDDYKGVDRSDDRTGATVSATFLINRAVGLNVSYAYYNVDSSGAARDKSYDINRVLASLTYQF